MTQKKKFNITAKHLFIFLMISAVLVNIKTIFTDYNIDSGYAIATSYRQLLGDRMFSDMWEPHQTSAFLCTFFMWIYTTVFQTTTGIVLFLNTVGVLLKGLVTYFVYHTFKPFVHPFVLYSMCIFFFTVSPKGMVLPEFSNMQLWFSICLFCCLIKYFHDPNHKKYLLFSGLFLCLEIISYPSCIVVYIGVIILIALYSKNKLFDIFLFSGECFLLGISYIGFFIARTGWQEFIQNCRYIIMSDASHSTSVLEKFSGYLREAGEMALLYLVIGLCTFIISKLTSRNAAKIFFIIVFVCDFLKTLTSTASFFERFPIYIPVLLFSLFTLSDCDPEERRIHISGVIISSFGMLATLLLTNLSLEVTLSYLPLAIMTAFIPLANYSTGHFCSAKQIVTYSGIFLFLLLTIFYYGFIIKCMGSEKSNLLHVGGIVKSGPALGIVSEYMGPYIMNTTIPEYREHVKPDDQVLIISSSTLDPIMYLYQENAGISVDSTICTPTYSEKLLTYWEQHPEKKPNVVLVECWFGDVRVNQESWIMDWLSDEFDTENYTNGTYWRYYHK